MTTRMRSGMGTMLLVGAMVVAVRAALVAHAVEGNRPMVAAPAAPSGPLLGSADFMPTPDHPVGWRGDGTGHYPGATPPPFIGNAAARVSSVRSGARRADPRTMRQPVRRSTVASPRE